MIEILTLIWLIVWAGLIAGSLFEGEAFPYAILFGWVWPLAAVALFGVWAYTKTLDSF